MGSLFYCISSHTEPLPSSAAGEYMHIDATEGVRGYGKVEFVGLRRQKKERVRRQTETTAASLETFPTCFPDQLLHASDELCRAVA